MGFEEFGHVEFRCFEDLGFSDVDVVERVDSLFASQLKITHTEDEVTSSRTVKGTQIEKRAQER